ncbi:26S proteasome regulatory subunit [Toxoplasma gondii p89]|uniref:26S proteasome regulatory subunit n=1 Tax=Toxoplasma gondii p89 TaxID=943119 RepID=A0A086J663_TOXGO|nr:26S proteasome regulatory subunit [Toxoplasma gondii p89]
MFCSEALYEDESFAERQLAGFIASRVYFHLEEYGEALKFALGSGNWFDITQKSLYVQRMLGKLSVSEHISLRS